MNKKFYIIKIKDQYIGIDKNLTEEFESANLYQGNPDNMYNKLIKDGYNANDIQISTFQFEMSEPQFIPYIAIKRGENRDKKIDEILND